MPVNKELRNNLLTAFFTAALTAAGFLGKEYADEKNRQQQYIGELYRQLYDKSAIELEKINSVLSEIQTLLGKGYALTAYDFSESHAKLREAVESYKKYVRELERLGSSGQIQAAKGLEGRITGLYAEFDLQYRAAEQVQHRVGELLLVEDVNSDLFKAVKDAMDSDIERLIQSENRVYYQLAWFRRPVLEGLNGYLNYQFRLAIGLDLTADIVKAVNNLPVLLKRASETEYKESSIPFVFAEVRDFSAPTLDLRDDSVFLNQKNEILKDQVKMKFVVQVIQNDKYIQEVLKKRKSASESNR